MPERMFPIPVLNNKQKCPYLAIHLECNVGGPATADCFHPHFHQDCHHRKKADSRYDRLDLNKKADDS